MSCDETGVGLAGGASQSVVALASLHYSSSIRTGMGFRKRFGCGTDTWLSSGLHEPYLSVTDMAALSTLDASPRLPRMLGTQQIMAARPSRC